MSRGCPLGSSFGSLLWNLFQNDMTLLVKDTNLFMYADDHQLYVTGSDYNITSSRLQYQVKLTMSGYRDNFLLANTEKFQCLTINLRNIDPDKQTEALQIEDQIISNTFQITLLGVEIDDKLNFTSHISNICIKASQKVITIIIIIIIIIIISEGIQLTKGGFQWSPPK